MTLSGHRDLVERLRYTFITADYDEIDVLIAGLAKKDNFTDLCGEFFAGCKVDAMGYLVPAGFFHDGKGSSSLIYAMYEILGRAPDSFALKQQVSKVKFIRKNLSGRFRFPKGVLFLPALEVLVVRGIGISRFPVDRGGMRSLKVLDLTGNRFTEIPRSLLNSGHLSALNLSYNRLQKLPDSPGRLGSLKILSLRGNRITSLPESWYDFGSLRVLDVAMNRIAELPARLELPQSLKDLRLSYNDLPASDEAMWELKVRGQGSPES